MTLQPITPKLVDPFGRTVDYVRVSVTDRCNLRCIYCVREPLRASPSDELINAAIDRALAAKPKSHDFELPMPGQAPALARHMSVTGG